jgi:plastocyanin
MRCSNPPNLHGANAYITGFLVITIVIVVTQGLAPAAEPRTTGQVSGRVSVAGEIPRPSSLPVLKNRDFCGSAVPNETLLVSGDGGLRNAVVILQPRERAMAAQTGQLVLDNQRCAFVPHVQVAPLGTELLLKNTDPILHTVHARIDKETLFNVGLPRWREVSKTLDRAGVIRITCDVLHTWMSAVIIVTASPHYSITDETGHFTINGLPVGLYQVEIFHEKLGTKRAQISVTDGTTLSLDVVYRLGK